MMRGSEHAYDLLKDAPIKIYGVYEDMCGSHPATIESLQRYSHRQDI